jgi:hypothetical protein
LVAAREFPEYRATLLTVIVAGTMFFEVVGPIFTRIALQHTETG